jgi:hypothetical protein
MWRLSPANVCSSLAAVAHASPRIARMLGGQVQLACQTARLIALPYIIRNLSSSRSLGVDSGARRRQAASTACMNEDTSNMSAYLDGFFLAFQVGRTLVMRSLTARKLCWSIIGTVVWWSR